MSVLRDAAVGYAHRRRPVFPVGVDKKPLTRHGFKDATTDERTAGRLWTEHPSAGIATPTGPNWFVLDVDDHRALELLEAEHGSLPPTVEVVTPRPGRHLYLLGAVTNSSGALPADIHVRGRGGYVLLPPSPHENGVYEWRTAPDESPIATAPAWLLELLASPANGTGRGEHEAPAGLVPHGRRDPYLLDFGIRILRGGLVDRELVAAHLRCEFDRACEPLPPPAPRYFERMAASLLQTRIADRERSRANASAFFAERHPEGS